jgi:hypothetical protein
LLRNSPRVYPCNCELPASLLHLAECSMTFFVQNSHLKSCDSNFKNRNPLGGLQRGYPEKRDCNGGRPTESDRVGHYELLVETGAALAEKVSVWASFTPEQRRLLIACDPGTGMAAAYKVPLGGTLFAVEVLLGTTSVTTILAALTTSFLAVAVSWTMLPNAPAFSVAPLFLSRSILLFAVLAGPFLEIASAF